MYITVRLLNGFQKPLLYKLSEQTTSLLTGSLVTVPLQKRYEAALIIGTQKEISHPISFTIKEVSLHDIKLIDPAYFRFIQTLSIYYQTDIMHFARRLQQCISAKENEHLFLPLGVLDQKVTQHTLTAEQSKIYQACTQAIHNPRFFPALLHGVTGSGKTEIYKKLLSDCIQQRKTALFLLPEVTLALQFEQLLRAEMEPTIPIMSFHSATSTKQKKNVWHAITQQEPCIIIGVHLPILLPIANLGLIIIDEEHDTGYQEKKHPRIHTKEAALIRAQQYNIPIIMGSATPSLTALYNVKTKNYAFFQLTQRFSGNFSDILLVNMKDIEPKKRAHYWISSTLKNAIEDRLHKKEQCIIFLNRRGHSFFVQCKKCSTVFSCKQCSVSLTLHENNLLHCHYCSYHQKEPSLCPSCKAPKDQFLKKGIGTQQLVTIMQQLFPHARIARADLDTTQTKKTWQKIVQQFSNKELDILVGTQTITKGYHFPGVTLVGIVWADLNVHLPFYNAQEVCLQQLIQVAGRAGRASQKSLVVVQTMTDHDLFSYLDEKKYLNFYKQEMENRNILSYPPFTRLIAIELKHLHEETVAYESGIITKQLKQIAKDNNYALQILGPAKPMVHKIKKTYTRIIYIKSNTLENAIRAFKSISKKNWKSALFFVPNPLQ